MGHYYSRNFHYENEPATRTGPDPAIFEKYKDEERPVREMAATTEEMDLGRVPRQYRDYCAHAYMALMKCRRDWSPEFFRCHKEVEALYNCQGDDGFHRKLEYERTRRLMNADKE